MRNHRAWLRPLLTVLLTASGCGTSDSGGSFAGDKEAYGVRGPTSVFDYQLTFMGAVTPLTGINLGPKTIAGKSFDRGSPTRSSKPDHGVEFWVAEHPADQSIDFGGVDSRSVVFPVFTATLDTPVHVALAPTVGQAQPVSVALKLTSPTDPVGQPAQITAQYTLAETGVAVMTPMGNVTGLSHFTGSGQVTGASVPAAFAGVTVHGDLWYHPSFGIVAVRAPELGLDLGLTDTHDCGTPDSSGHAIARKVGVLDGNHPRFSLDTYDCAQAFDADKDTHAQMLLELRWLDENNARTDNKPGYPMVHIEFGTVFGIFPIGDVIESPISILHPEENGKGFKYWLMFVNQAAKNESTNGIAYHVQARLDPGFSAIRASARIYYKKLP